MQQKPCCCSCSTARATTLLLSVLGAPALMLAQPCRCVTAESYMRAAGHHLYAARTDAKPRARWPAADGDTLALIQPR